MLWKRNSGIYHEKANSLAQIYSQNNPYNYPQRFKKASDLDNILLKPKTNLNSLAPSPLQSIVSTEMGIIKEKQRPSKSTSQKKKSNKFYVSKGNNHLLVRAIMLDHGYNEGISKQQAQIIWVQTSSQLQKVPSNCYIINFLQNHQNLTNKQKLYRNLMKYNSGSNDVCGSYLPKTFVLDFKTDPTLGFIEFLKEYFSLAGKEGRAKLRKLQQKNADFTIFNSYLQLRIPFRKIYTDNKADSKSVDETLWILKPTSLNRGEGIHVFQSIKQLRTLLSQDSNLISVKMYQDFHGPSSYVIQKYIQRPLLIQGYKFDIRMWMLLVMPKKEIVKAYMFDQGYVRLASVKYQNIENEQKDDQKLSKYQNIENPSANNPIQKNRNDQAQKLQPQLKSMTLKPTKNIADRYVHLTNNAVQKNSKNYGVLYEGNQMSLEQLQQYFRGDLNINDMLLKMKQIMIDSVNSVKGKIGISSSNGVEWKKSFKRVDKEKQRQKSNIPFDQFQLLGLDFLLDENKKLWLIEINSNPCLEQSSALLSRLLKGMLNGVMQIIKNMNNKLIKKTILEKEINSIQFEVESPNRSQKICQKFDPPKLQSSKISSENYGQLLSDQPVSDLVRIQSQISYKKYEEQQIYEQNLQQKERVNSQIHLPKWERIV